MPGSAVIAKLVSEPPLLSSIDVHVVDFEIAVAGGCEDDLLAVGRNGAFRVVTIRCRQPLHIGSVGLCREDVVRRINLPDITFGTARCRWAIRRSQMRRSVDHSLSVRCEVTARRPAFSGTDQMYIRA